MNTRDRYRYPKVLKMWYVYNRSAITSSHDLCRVVSSHKGIMNSPETELNRVYTELKDRCGVPVPKMPTKSIISAFVDTKLNHGNGSNADDPDCTAISSNPNVKF